jgi:hypothetical protein
MRPPSKLVCAFQATFLVLARKAMQPKLMLPATAAKLFAMNENREEARTLIRV